MASSDETIQGGNGLMVPDDKSLIIRTIAYFQDVVSKMDLQRLRTDGEAQGALLFCSLLFCFFGWLFYFFLRKAFLSKAGSSSGEAKLSCPTVQMENKEKDHGAAGGHKEDEQGGDDIMVPALPAMSQSWKPEIQVQDAENHFADIIEYIKNSPSREKLQQLLEEDKTWAESTSKVELSSEEAHALRETLAKCSTEPKSGPDTEPEGKLHQGDQPNREEFLKKFPQVKEQLEEKIKELHALAKKADKVHRDCTITNVVAASTGAFSGILSIAGLALAPVTGGVSLAITATGIGLGAAAAVTGATSAVVERVTSASVKAEANRLTSSSVNQVELVEEAVNNNSPDVVDVTQKCFQVVDDIGKNVRAIKLAQKNPELMASAKLLMQEGKISETSSKKVEEAFGGTALILNKEARLEGVATAGLILLKEVVKIIQQSVHLHQGAKSKLAQDLREQAQELEAKLAELMEINKNLQ